MKLFLVTASGRQIDPAAPRATEIHLSDIIAGLTKQERYDGHTVEPLSVAHHSCLVFTRVRQLLRTSPHDADQRRDIERAALMHDASEAYLGDIVAPLKALLPDYRRLENKWTALIDERFSISSWARAELLIHAADHDVFHLEAICQTLHPTLYGLTHEEAENARQFMGTSFGQEFHTLLGSRPNYEGMNHPQSYRAWSAFYFQACCNELGIY